MSARKAKAKKGRGSRPKQGASATQPSSPSPTPLPDEPLDGRGLSARELAFVEAFVGARFNASAAARVVYACEAPGSAASIGYEVRHRPHVASEIDRRLQAAQLGAAEVVALLSDHARGDLGRFITLVNGRPTFDLEALREEGASHLIKKVKIGADRSLTVELHDSQAALDRLARIHGMYKDQLKVETELTLDDLSSLAHRLDDLEASRGSG